MERWCGRHAGSGSMWARRGERARVSAVDFPFWFFSTEFYARPGVAPACLALQDRFGCDVNLMLFALWAARCGSALGPAEFARLDQAVEAWRGGVVEPVRRLRRSLKSDPLGAAPELAEACRRLLLEAELGAERAAQDLLARTVTMNEPVEGGVDRELARENLTAYLAWRRIDAPVARQLAGTILAAL